MTPGPWKWTKDAIGFYTTLVAATRDDEVIGAASDISGDTSIIVTESDAALIAKVPEMVELLRGLEWSAAGDYCLPVCPSCGFVPSRHAPDCRLHAILKLAEDASNGQ